MMPHKPRKLHRIDYAETCRSYLSYKKSMDLAGHLASLKLDVMVCLTKAR